MAADVDDRTDEDVSTNILANCVTNTLLYNKDCKPTGSVGNNKKRKISDVYSTTERTNVKVCKDVAKKEEYLTGTRFPKFVKFTESICPVNDVIKERVMNVLKKVGIKNLNDFLSNWKNTYRYYAVVNFADACDSYDLPYQLGHVQICAFFEHLDELYYSVKNLSAKWQTIKLIARELFINPTREQEAIFEHLKDNAAEIKDDKLPVSRRLLLELRIAADIVLVGYNALLAKTLFTCAWAFSMRICEYSETKPMKDWDDNKPSHNLRASSIRVSDFGVSAKFLSDKTAKYGNCIKHRSISWKKLPEGSRELINAYRIARPDADKFFCLVDGRPLTRTNVENLLDVCLLQTDWKLLKLTSHCFRQGRASQEIIEGESMEQLEFDARMTPGGGVFNHYSRSDLATLDPSEIFDDFPQCRRKWTPAHLKHLSRNVVERGGPGLTHPHHVVVRRYFPEEYKKIRHEMPAEYPFINVINRIKADNMNAESKHYICKQISAARVRTCDELRRKFKAQATRAALHVKRYRAKMAGEAEPPQGTLKWAAKPSKNTKILVPSHPNEIVKSCTGTQTANTYNADQSGSTFWYYGKKIPFHPDAQDLIPVVTSFRFDLFTDKIILRAEKQQDGGMPLAAKVKRNVMEMIKQRLFAESREHNVAKSTALRNNRVYDKDTYYAPSAEDLQMIHYFLLEYAAHGEKGLPPRMESVLNETKEATFERVKKAYEEKPDDYEDRFVPEHRCTAVHRYEKLLHRSQDNIREGMDAERPKRSIRTKPKEANYTEENNIVEKVQGAESTASNEAPGLEGTNIDVKTARHASCLQQSDHSESDDNEDMDPSDRIQALLEPPRENIVPVLETVALDETAQVITLPNLQEGEQEMTVKIIYKDDESGTEISIVE